MANISLQDAKQNEALASKLIDSEDKQVSAIVGLHALGQLAEMMPTKEFLQFVNESVEAANNIVQGTASQPEAQEQGEPEEDSSVPNQ
jgi:hypothetical protein